MTNGWARLGHASEPQRDVAAVLLSQFSSPLRTLKVKGQKFSCSSFNQFLKEGMVWKMTTTRRTTNGLCSLALLSMISGGASLMGQQNQPVLETNSHRRQMEAAVYAYFQAVDALDPQHYANLFAPDGTLEDPVGTGLYHGRTQIAGALAAGLPIIGRLTPRVKDIFVASGESTEAAVYWVITGYTKQGKQLVVQGIGIFKFKPMQGNSPLQLESVREFYDPVQYLSQVQ